MTQRIWIADVLGSSEHETNNKLGQAVTGNSIGLKNNKTTNERW